MVRYNTDRGLIEKWASYIRLGRKSTGFRGNNPEYDKIFKKVGKIAIFVGNKSTSSFALVKGGEEL